MNDVDYVSSYIEFTGDEFAHLIEWAESLNERLETSENFPLNKKIPIFFKNEWKFLAVGYWQVSTPQIYLASRNDNDSNDNPSFRCRALVVLSALEYVDFHCQERDRFADRLRRLEARLLTYLPVREVPEWGDGLYVACKQQCQPERVAGLAVNALGEIIAIRTRGLWVTLTGEELAERPSADGVAIIEWEA